MPGFKCVSRKIPFVHYKQQMEKVVANNISTEQTLIESNTKDLAPLVGFLIQLVSIKSLVT